MVLLVAVAAIWRLDDALLGTITDRYALLLYGVGGVLAAFFRRSRVVVALVVIAVVDLATGPASATSAADPLLPLATVLVGVLGILASLRDRGVTSRGGLVQLGVGTGVVATAYLVFRGPDMVAAFYGVQMLPTGASPGGVPQATLVVGSISLVAAAYGVYRWRGPVERGFAWAQVMILVAMAPALVGPEAGVMLMAAGLVLSASVLEQTYFMAYRDELTGLPARRALMNDLADIRGTYSVAMVDVDHFKKFNDTHGHDVGDQVLKLVASRLEAGPGGGKAYRYGGEEFTLLYPGRISEDAVQHAEAVRDSVERASFSLRAWNRPREKPAARSTKKSTPKKPKAKKKTKKAGPKRSRKLSVTVSVGLADADGDDTSPETVLKRADEALYRAKEGGRNRVAT